VNGHNLGRFWYIGPQQTLYCPGVWLRERENEIVVLELEDKGKRTIQGLQDPILNQLNPDQLAPPLPKRTVSRVQLDSADRVATGSFVPGDTEQVVILAHPGKVYLPAVAFFATERSFRLDRGIVCSWRKRQET